MLKRILLTASLGGVIAVGLAWYGIVRSQTLSRLLEKAAGAARAEHWSEAEKYAAAALLKYPTSEAAAMAAAKAALNLNKPQQALVYIQSLPPGEDYSRDYDLLAARISLAAQQVPRSIEYFKSALTKSPNDPEALAGLAFAQTKLGQLAEAVKTRIELLKQGDSSIDLLMFVGAPHLFAPSSEMAAAQEALEANRLEEAENRAVALVQRDPSDSHVALLGRVLIEKGDLESLMQWKAVRQIRESEHPDIWFVRGMLAQRQDEPRAAARCFWEAVRANPNHQAACYQLALALNAVGQDRLAAIAEQRSTQLRQFLDTLKLIQQDNQPQIRELRRAVELCHAMGRYWEQKGWMSLSAERYPANGGISPPPLPDVDPEASQVAFRHDVAAQMDLASFPLPSFKAIGQSQPTARSGSRIQFEDVARAAGIVFQYVNGDDPATIGRRMLEVTGGGIAILDYDQDGWPDIYVTQGCRLPIDPAQTEFQNRLFRNQADGSFLDVTEQSGVGDRHFGQGVAVGDFDNDGFPDLYVANEGANQLYHNCGDGTFQNVTETAGLAGTEWTTSCLICDLNGDGLPDIYDVNYLKTGPNIDLICDTPGGPRCSPERFAAQEDRLYLNLGDGRFEDVSKTAGIAKSHGKGLGVLAGDLDGSGQISLLVANDTTANSWFQNQVAPGETPRFRDVAVIKGLAYDWFGRAQGSMGIACGDVDNDGRSDLYVTNFFREANTLYRQSAPGTFRDSSRQVGLADASFALLGFGTQFLDADLDGWEDLVVTNGHVGNYSDRGQPFQMRAQFFRNQAGRFEEISHQAGDYFQRPVLGRPLATLDYNRDGRPDFVVTHLDAPLALLRNQSPQNGHFLALRLQATIGNRDAIGAQVRLRFAGERRYRTLTAGDGYQASNQRQLMMGLGQATRVDTIEVRWPGGTRSTYGPVQADQHLVLIEGRSEPFVIVP